VHSAGIVCVREELHPDTNYWRCRVELQLRGGAYWIRGRVGGVEYITSALSLKLKSCPPLGLVCCVKLMLLTTRSRHIHSYGY
jgi:ABC-type cobalamin transport system permease subunit